MNRNPFGLWSFLHLNRFERSDGRRCRLRQLLLVLSVVFPFAASAQTGQLIGKVTDASDGNPLPGASVFIEATQQGAAADAEGRYRVIGITPGEYTVRYSFVGYTTQEVEIRVVSSVPTEYDVALQSQAIGGEEVDVIATRPVVDPNQTNARALITGEQMEALPVTSLEDAIAQTSNSFDGHVRGSRRFETKTIVEGIDVSDAFYALSAGSNYEGAIYANANRAGETNSSILSLNPEGIEEVTVNSGATEAQYASGSGGVVAVTLAEDRGPLHGSISARISPSIPRPGPDSLAFYYDGEDYLAERGTITDPLKQALYTWTPDKYPAGEDPEMDIRASIGGSITDRWNFSASGQLFQTHGFLPNYSRKRISGQVKTSYNVTSTGQLTAIGIFEDKGLWGGWNNTDYMELWRFYLEGVAQHDGGTYVGSLRWREILSPTSYFTAQAYRTFDKSRYGYVDDDGDGFQEIGENGDFLDFTDPEVVDQYISLSATRDEAGDPKMFIDIVSDGFSETGLITPDGSQRYRLARPAPFSENRTSVTNAFKVDYVNQASANHLVQTGVELKLRRFSYQVINGLPGTGAILNDEVEPFRLSDWERRPWELSLYASDRMHYSGLIVNLGLRVALVNRDMEKIQNYFYPMYRDSIEVAGGQVYRNFVNRGESVPLDVMINPSIGVSHPIGESASMYFSYSRSQQLLPYSELYRYYDGLHTTTRFFTIPNPEMDPITSNNYELGVQWEFAPGWGVDVNTYMRNIDNYGGVTYTAFNATPEGEESLAGFDRYTYRTTAGYADARGIELVLRRRPVEIAAGTSLGLSASYTYSTVERAQFTGNNPRTFSFDEETGETQLPFEDAEHFENFPQNVSGGSAITGGYDRRHRFIVRGVASFPYDFSAGLVGTLESGILYPRAIGADPRDRELLTGPTNYQIDLRLEKKIDIGSRFGVDLFLDVTNLTNRENVIAYESDTPSGPVVFQETGIPGSRLVLDDGSLIYGTPRMIYFGSRFRF